MTGKCKPGKVSRTVSTSLLTLDLTVKCTSGVKVPPPGASTQGVLPPATVAHIMTAAGTSTPFVATPAPVVEQPGVHAKGFPTLRSLESPELLPLFGLSSPSPSPTLPWGAADNPAVLSPGGACGTLRLVRVFLDQYQCRLAARV